MPLLLAQVGWNGEVTNFLYHRLPVVTAYPVQVSTDLAMFDGGIDIDVFFFFFFFFLFFLFLWSC